MLRLQFECSLRVVRLHLERSDNSLKDREGTGWEWSQAEGGWGKGEVMSETEDAFLKQHPVNSLHHEQIKTNYITVK